MHILQPLLSWLAPMPGTAVTVAHLRNTAKIATCQAEPGEISIQFTTEIKNAAAV